MRDWIILFDSKLSLGRKEPMKRHSCFIFVALMFFLVLLFCGCVKVPNQIVLDSVTASKALDVAIKQIGKPYVLGGRGAEEFD